MAGVIVSIIVLLFLLWPNSRGKFFFSVGFTNCSNETKKLICERISHLAKHQRKNYDWRFWKVFKNIIIIYTWSLAGFVLTKYLLNRSKNDFKVIYSFCVDKFGMLFWIFEKLKRSFGYFFEFLKNKNEILNILLKNKIEWLPDANTVSGVWSRWIGPPFRPASAGTNVPGRPNTWTLSMDASEVPKIFKNIFFCGIYGLCFCFLFLFASFVYFLFDIASNSADFSCEILTKYFFIKSIVILQQNTIKKSSKLCFVVCKSFWPSNSGGNFSEMSVYFQWSL